MLATNHLSAAPQTLAEFAAALLLATATTPTISASSILATRLRRLVLLLRSLARLTPLASHMHASLLLVSALPPLSALALVNALLTLNATMEMPALVILATLLPRLADGRTLPLLAMMVMLALLMSATSTLVAFIPLFLPISVMIKASALTTSAIALLAAYTPILPARMITCALMISATPSVVASVSQ